MLIGTIDFIPVIELVDVQRQPAKAEESPPLEKVHLVLVGAEDVQLGLDLHEEED